MDPNEDPCYDQEGIGLHDGDEGQGAKCQRRSDMHFAVVHPCRGVKGSSNSTANGLFGRLEEQNDVFLSYSDEGGYSEQRDIMELANRHSADYFDGTVEIHDAEITTDYLLPHPNETHEFESGGLIRKRLSKMGTTSPPFHQTTYQPVISKPSLPNLPTMSNSSL